MDAQCPICKGALRPTAIKTQDRQYDLPEVFAVEECPACEVGVTVPQLNDAALAPHYGEGYSGYAMSKSRLRAWQRHRQVERQPFNDIAAREGRRLLDVGCGSGQIGIELMRRSWTVAGVDPSSEAVKAANELGIVARVGDISAWDGDPDGFDVVVFHHSLEHIPDPVDSLRRAAALVAARDGVVAVAVPNWGAPLRRLLGRNWFQLDVPRHRWHFTPRALSRAAETAGLRVEAIGTTASIQGFLGSIGYRIFGRRKLPKHFITLGTVLLFPLERVLGPSDTAYLVARPGISRVTTKSD
jgi:SAM-dependent methyltransferase